LSFEEVAAQSKVAFEVSDSWLDRRPAEIRKIIYTTNAIESLNMQLRKAIKNRGIFRAMRRPRK
jgi:transposase-like protein